MKCKYTEWKMTNRDCHDDVCSLCESGTRYCYGDENCPDFEPAESPIKEKIRINYLCDVYLDGFTAGIV